jgi:hypothetical protein
MSKLLFKDKDVLQKRDLSNLDADKAAVKALVQAAINVELFTIPLYMASLYSIQGMHQINGSKNNFYQGRLWPGMSISRGKPEELTSNQDAFNKVFSVFIAEMLHLQLASNIANAVDHLPCFTSPMLQNSDHSWNCYGSGITVIPHVLDFKDMLPESKFYGQIVKLDSLNATQVKLFLAIEETENDAEENFSPEVWKAKYSPVVPFSGWTAQKTEADLPLFGTIGQMYLSLWEYFSIAYTDGTTLWSKMYVPNAVQQDLFNSSKYVTKPQYPKMNVQIDESDPEDVALKKVLDMIDGITDQGEGSGVGAMIRKRLKLQQLTAVQNKYQPDGDNLAEDYPSYNDKGEKLPTSADVSARAGANGAMDHYEIFKAVQQLIGKKDYMTWDTWHQQGNSWKTSDLITNQADYELNRKNYPQLPEAADIAGALNRLKQNNTENNYDLLSRASTGSVAGMTTVLDNFWSTPDAQFPMPAMGGTGDRMSICWAIFGKSPDLSRGVPDKDQTTLYHACQGMNLDPKQTKDPKNCAAVSVYHTCIGSNNCRAEGGCGFVQLVTGGGSCHQSAGNSGGQAAAATASTQGSNPGSTGHAKLLRGVKAEEQKNSPQANCGAPTVYSAPSDNKCGAFGGCAVPISASQMYPKPKYNMIMEHCDFVQNDQEHWHAEAFGTPFPYQVGDLVHDVAWNAYTAVLQHRGQPVPDKPKPNDIRLAFPPST